jgi:hypothetical protein
MPHPIIRQSDEDSPEAFAGPIDGMWGSRPVLDIGCYDAEQHHDDEPDHHPGTDILRLVDAMASMGSGADSGSLAWNVARDPNLVSLLLPIDLHAHAP